VLITGSTFDVDSAKALATILTMETEATTTVGIKLNQNLMRCINKFQTYLLLIVFAITISNGCKKSDNVTALTTVTDYDGNVYHTIVIGTQTWTVENLKVTHYRNGDSIANVTGNSVWKSLTTGAYCWYNNNIDNKTPYGALYNWFTVNDSRNIAPIGWHVPTDAEWTILTTYLGGEIVAGGKMKETDTTHWCNPNSGATNESGFTALPSGLRHSYDGTFGSFRIFSGWWSSTADGATSAWVRGLDYSHARCDRSNYGYTQFGFAVRLVKD